MMNEPSPQEALARLIEDLDQEWTHLQVVGRQRTPEEEERSEVLSEALDQLRSAREILAGRPAPQLQVRAAPPLVDGRYTGGNGELAIELRVDEAVCGVISADLFRRHAGGETWVASVRTPPGSRISLAERTWEVVAEDQQQALGSGQLRLGVELTEPLTVAGVLRLDQPLAGIAGQQDVAFTAVWASEALRALGLELEQEEGVADLPTFDFRGAVVTVESALAQAGFETFEVGQHSLVPKPSFPWGTAQLHALMQDHAQALLTRSAWELHLLLLDRSSREGLFGVMFDTTAELPRQGSAVFAGEIRKFAGADFERKLIQTTVHELGHALNLAHRFERVCGRADSTSFMNYDWRYRGGGRRQEFWSRFNFTFDADELEFLRHAPRSAVIPGGRAFHSVSYWAEGNGGYTPYYPEVEIDDLELTLTGPAGGLVFDFLQPVFLQVELTNRSGEAFNLDERWLDPKSGDLNVVIRRLTGGEPHREAQLWVPVMQRCFQPTPGTLDVVPDGGSIRNNLNLTFGAGGFAFAEPGEYEVQAIVSLPISSHQKEYVIPSNSLRIRVGHPRTREEDKDALVVLRDEVGLYFALGGSRVLDKAQSDLEQVRARRQGRAEKIKDPLVANIVRCAGIDSGRAYLRHREGKYLTEEGDRERAAELLESLDDQALRAFDPHTAAGTRGLARKHRRAVS